jgi:hypothetical protein
MDSGEWVECSPELENARKNKPHKAGHHVSSARPLEIFAKKRGKM